MNHAALKFKDLGNGETFEFASPVKGVSELGPWMRIGKRKYMAADVQHRLNGIEIEVGSVNVAVVASTR